MDIRIEGLTHTYGSTCALDDVSIHLKPGFSVLLGPNGAGKSTLFSLLTGLSPLGQGKITFDGNTIKHARKHIMSRLGVVFQQSTLDIDLTVRQNLSYFASLHGIASAPGLAQIAPVLNDLDLVEKLDKKVRELNGGHRRRVEIARCFIHKPSVLLLDEPTVGLDIASRKLIVEVVHQLAEQHQVTVLWATHLLEEVRQDDHLILLSKGKVKGQDTCAALLAAFSSDTVDDLFNQVLGKA